jgi:hypothetical protein
MNHVPRLFTIILSGKGHKALCRLSSSSGAVEALTELSVERLGPRKAVVVDTDKLVATV